MNVRQLYGNGSELVTKYGSYIKAIDESIAEGGASKYLNNFGASEMSQTSLCVLLNNAAVEAGEARRIVDESGLSSAGLSTMNVIKNIETTLFDLFTGTAAQMLSYRVVAVQPITTPNAYVYYFDFKYANTKGNIEAGTPLLSHISSQTLGYAGSNVYGEKVTGATHTLAYTPVTPGTVMVSNGTDVAIDNGKGGFTGGSFALSVDYATGKLITVATEGVELTVNYKYDTEIAEPNPIQAELVSVAVQAEVKTLKTTSTLSAVLNAKSVLGVDLSDVSLEVATRELAAEFDFDIFRDLLSGCSVTLTVENFDRNVEEYDSFVRRYGAKISEASNGIFNATQKLEASFIICGTDHASIIDQSPKFVAYNNVGNYSSGPRLMGTFNNLEVIKVPSTVYPANAMVIGAKSDIPVLGAGYIFSPYILAFPSQLISDPNLRVSQGFISMAAKAMVNNSLYVRLDLI